jgi:thioredoxin reductase
VIHSVDTDIVVLGAGPAGLAAACAALEAGARVLVLEREDRLGGILKQCIHDGFGLVRYHERLSGPEYALRDVDRLERLGAQVMQETFVSTTRRVDNGFELTCVDRGGVFAVRALALILATGCRERTDRQAFVQGDRPAGIYTAGLAQYMINIQGVLPGRRAVILGSGDIGLIMARRMTLEGMDVVAAHEVKPEPSGLSRNIHQCLEDYGIPLELSSTVTAVHGTKRVERVTVASVDGSMRPIAGTEHDIPCDTLILSVGLIPENELAQSLGVPLDPATKGPFVDQTMHTLAEGIFACGNAVHVNDLADYVSESGELAGASAARYVARRRDAPVTGMATRTLVAVRVDQGFLYAVPQYIDTSTLTDAVMYFRARRTMPSGAVVTAEAGGKTCFKASYPLVRPPEMERFVIPHDTLMGALAARRDDEGLGLRMEAR